jgi:hypothetical protein
MPFGHTRTPEARWLRCLPDPVDCSSRASRLDRHGGGRGIGEQPECCLGKTLSPGHAQDLHYVNRSLKPSGQIARMGTGFPAFSLHDCKL